MIWWMMAYIMYYVGHVPGNENNVTENATWCGHKTSRQVTVITAISCYAIHIQAAQEYIRCRGRYDVFIYTITQIYNCIAKHNITEDSTTHRYIYLHFTTNHATQQHNT